MMVSIDARPVLASPQVERFTAFVLLGLTFLLAYHARWQLVVARVLGSAVGLEMLQLLTRDRHARVLDALVKATGGICGISAGQLILLLLQTHINRAR
jgi:hypothetical protein